MVSAILTESHEPSDAYFSNMGVSVVSPNATYLSFLLKLSPIFKSQIMWQFIFWYPIVIPDSAPSNTYNGGLTDCS